MLSDMADSLEVADGPAGPGRACEVGGAAGCAGPPVGASTADPSDPGVAPPEVDSRPRERAGDTVRRAFGR
ncbi:hypothetical protein GCM10018790_62260 [Kitasatospora xanthocidica]|nr:hypothetical protein GCM10018790_62260 [Kitasatospora xanthocidica]